MMPFVPARLIAVVTLLFAVSGFSGCNSVKPVVNPLTRSYEPTNVGGPDYLPIEVRRVAVLPVFSALQMSDASCADIDRAFGLALTRAARFESIAVSREQLRAWVHRATIESTGLVPAELFPALREHLGADAVLFIDVTHYSPYPPLQLGLRTRLVQLDNGADLWATDELFDASRADIAAGARRHYLQGPPAAADLSSTVLQSPARFAIYAADTLVATLPRR